MHEHQARQKRIDSFTHEPIIYMPSKTERKEDTTCRGLFTTQVHLPGETPTWHWLSAGAFATVEPTTRMQIGRHESRVFVDQRCLPCYTRSTNSSHEKSIRQSARCVHRFKKGASRPVLSLLTLQVDLLRTCIGTSCTTTIRAGRSTRWPRRRTFACTAHRTERGIRHRGSPR